MIRYTPLREKLLADVKTDEFGVISFYVNPQTLKNFKKGIRGVIDKKGNLYVWEPFDDFVHIDAVRVLGKQYFKMPAKMIQTMEYGYVDDVLPYCCPVKEKYGPDRGIFYLSESFYHADKKLTQQYYEKAKQVNPQFEFINQKITEVE